MLRKGGWNYGNANMLGQDLKPFVPTTALTLLSLQDRQSLPEVARSVAFLEREATSERSGTALALALMALRAYGRSTDAVRDTLVAQLPTTLNLGKIASAAMSLYALSEADRHAAVVLQGTQAGRADCLVANSSLRLPCRLWLADATGDRIVAVTSHCRSGRSWSSCRRPRTTWISAT